jgi:hypothetical protein
MEAVIRAPEQVVPDADDPKREIYQSRFRDVKRKQKLLRIVVEEKEDEIVAVTAYPTSQLRRYWRGAP